MATEYTLTFSDGQTPISSTSKTALEKILSAMFPHGCWGHEGDLDDGGECTMCWANVAEAQEDLANWPKASKAVATLERN
jgi:hypothetical protein